MSSLHKFLLGIVLPSFLAIILFIVSVYVIIIPNFERNVMAVKKDMINQLTNTAWSLVDEFYKESVDSIFSDEEAKEMTLSRIEKMRYGNEAKDYFWICDMNPVMLMHPYRSELIDSSLQNYSDPNGKKLFVEAVEIVKDLNEGYIDYYWQWKDDSNKVVPKISYVKSFEPWGWIIGTGIYIEDVRQEIKSLQKRLLNISFLITALVVMILLFVIRQSLKIETKRKNAENELKFSRLKYKSLVEASSVGTLMIVNNKIIFSNQVIANLLDIYPSDIVNKRLDSFFDINCDDYLEALSNTKESFNVESSILAGKNSGEEVILSLSKMEYNDQMSIIVIVKQITTKMQLEKEAEKLSYELQTSLLLMNQAIKSFVQPILKSNMDESVSNIAKLMSRKNQDIVFISNNEKLIGVVNDYDLRTRVLSESLNLDSSASDIMSSPILSIKENAMIFEAVLMFNTSGVSHLAVKDSKDNIVGMISKEQILSIHKNSLSYLIKEIEISENNSSLISIKNRLPVLVQSLLDSGALIQNITRIVSSLTDAITKRIIHLTIEEIGTPSCKFAFIALGSEGRMEQSMSTDQDNAIIIEDLNPDQETKDYFLNLAKKVNNALHETGYELCKGEVMAGNPKWNQPLSTWKEYFKSWIINPNPTSILESSIFFDMRFIYGEESLVDELKGYIYEEAKDKATFYHHLAQSVLKMKVPISMFGQIKANSEDDTQHNLDIKKVLMPIIGFVRVYSLFNQIYATNSIQRIKKLQENNYINKEFCDELLQSYNFLMTHRFRSQTHQLINNTAPDNIIDTKVLSDIEKTTLRKVLSGITTIQSKLSMDFKAGI